MYSPSGDHLKLLGVSSSRVTGVVAPSASIQRTWICCPPGSPGARYAMRVPSGDQRGFDPFTRNRWRPPSASMIRISESKRSSILLTSDLVKTICVPSGEIRGSATRSMSR